jgi:hypothetical protein
MAEGIEIETVEFFPNRFFDHDVNEPFAKEILQTVFGGEGWRYGDPQKKEPDLFFGEISIELTLACDRNTTENYIRKIKAGDYTTEDAEAEQLRFIDESIFDKTTRIYSVDGVNLCVICTIAMQDWVSDYYGSVTHFIVDWRRQQYFEDLRSKYINSGKFSNIYILFPDLCASWWLFDLKTESRKIICLTDEQINSGKYPYVMIKKCREKLIDDGVLL